MTTALTRRRVAHALCGLLVLLPLLSACPDVEEEDPSPTVLPTSSPLYPDLEVRPTSLDFGQVTVSDEDQRTLTVSNQGVAALEVSSVALAPAEGSDYLLTEPVAAFSLDPLEARDISVRFAPSQEGEAEAWVVILSNDPYTARLEVPLLGEGVLIPPEDLDEDGYSVSDGDCDDHDASVHPGAAEACDGVDNDCDGATDEGQDADGDGTPDCSDDDGDGFTELGGDCDDLEAGIHPDADEWCDGVDNNCDGVVDEGQDEDGDGTPDCSDDDGDGFTELEGDCQDGDSSIFPAAPEQCDGVDSNCDGVVDDDFDADGDGTSDCVDDDEDGFSEDQGDCNDQLPAQNPGEVEQCNGLDDNCNGEVDEGADFDADQDGYTLCGGDCNDEDGLINPDAAEICDQLDDNCNGEVDEGLPVQVSYQDSDSDGYGTSSQTASGCAIPAGYVSISGDCNDENASVYPGAAEACNGLDDDCDLAVDDGVATQVWYLDGDGDGWGRGDVSTASCAAPAGYVSSGADCDDANAAIHPEAEELCNGLDDDCDGQLEDGVPTQTWYQDQDRDGFGNPAATVEACAQPAGYVADNSDCDDDRADIHPGAVEQCNGLDDNCNGQVDEDIVTSTYYQDGDGDGFGNPDRTVVNCSRPNGYVTVADDCNDANAGVNPAATEACNGYDDDCDAQVDEGVQVAWYPDGDGDGYGSADSAPLYACASPNGYVGNAQDCDDANSSIYLGAPEQCNRVDDDCDGLIDDGLPTYVFYKDLDGDGYGDASQSLTRCGRPEGYVSDATDCNDSNAAINPGASEVCNQVDDNCNGLIDDGVVTYTWYPDQDGDGYGSSTGSTSACAQPAGYVGSGTDCDDKDAGVNPAASESCNGVDDDCDAQIDEGVKLTWYQDADGDGYGNAQGVKQSCAQPTGYVSNNTDCDDSRATAYPGAPELCNQLDDDCDKQVDEGVPTQAWYQDADGDGYGNATVSQQGCAKPAGYVADKTDCNDTKASINPGATEQCNGIDDNCNGQVDDGVATQTWYRDADGDGYGNASQSTTSCSKPTGYVSDKTDCDDTKASVNPGATERCNGIDDDCDKQVDEGVQTTWYQDKDGDGYGVSTTTQLACTRPVGYTASSGDCNDSNAAIYPGAPETCNQLDDDCDGVADDGVATSTWYQDADGDSYGNASVTKVSCAKPAGYVADKTDCNDADKNIHPGATELCNGIDEDCDGVADDGVPTSTWYQDADGDGYGNASVTKVSCSMPAGYVADKTDCNDASAAVHPGATEVCNGVDDDCDAQVDEGVKTTWYQDTDADGYGNSSVTQQACTKPTGYAAAAGDCNDANAAIHPGAAESCNQVDDDCDGQVDEGLATSSWYQDADGDGYGNPSVSKVSCSKPTGYVSDKTDCDDTKASINPAAVEQCNGIDDNCNGKIDDGVATSTWYQDLDNDGYGNAAVKQDACSKPSGYVSDKTDCDDTRASVNPGAAEWCNGMDDDCDKLIDEGVTTTWYKDNDGDGYGTSSTTQACSKPSGYAAVSGDCDDTKASVNPAATETCNGIDDDCDTQIDEGVLTTWYKDGDGDGYGTTTTTQACTKPAGYAAVGGDCDDTKASVNPGATELCNGIDDDCDAQVDEGVKLTWYRDADSDGYGNAASSTQACTQPAGYVSNSLDCNDSNAAINPGAAEVCDGTDNDCDAQVDEGVKLTWYRDADGDGYGSAAVSTQACTQPAGYVSNSLDCNDSDPLVNPGGIEICNALDDNCNGAADEGLSCPDTDNDGDGYTENQGDCNDASSTVRPVTVDGAWLGAEDGSYSKPYNTIQEGINAVSSTCPLVLVRPYTYKERIDFKGKATTVQALDGPTTTIIDGQAGGSVVTFKTGETLASVLDGFTIQNGKAAKGGGVLIQGTATSKASPTLINNVFSKNVATGAGGGALYVTYGSPLIEGNTFADNTGPTAASTTGALAGGAILLETSAPATITLNTFLRNTHVRGGAIGIKSAGSPVLELNQFTQNQAKDSSTLKAAAGGAIYVSVAAPSLVDNVFEGNTSQIAGGAMYLAGTALGDTKVTIDHSSFSGNQAGTVTAANDTNGQGGAIYGSLASLVLTECSFDLNAAGYLGGALFLQNQSDLEAVLSSFALNLTANTADTNGGAGGALYLSGTRATLDANLLQNNSSGVNGGAMYVTGASVLTLLDNSFAGNVATSNPSGRGQGGALFIDGGSGSLTGNAFEINAANEGGGALLLQGSAVKLMQNTFLRNTARSKGGAVWVVASSSTATAVLTNNLFVANKVTNTSAQGGAVHLSTKASSSSFARANLINNVFVENDCLYQGAGLFVGADSYGLVLNNLFYANKTREGLYVSATGGVPTVQYNDAFLNPTNYGGKPLDASNLQVDPQFQAYFSDGLDNDDFHLKPGSPVINMGSPDSAYNDVNGTRNDMGAYGGPDGGW